MARQRGGGILNWFRGLGRSRKVAPAPPSEPTRRLNIKNESYKDALKRDYVFFSYKLKGLPVPKDKRFVSPQEEAEVRNLLLDADRKGMSTDEIIRSLFQSNPKQFEDEFAAWEQYSTNGVINKGTPYERKAFSVAKTVGRFIATIKGSPQNIAYQSNFMQHICEIPDMDKRVTTLSDDYCISLITPENKETFEQGKGMAYPVSYLLVKPEFFPKGTTGGGPVTLSAKRLLTISFILDAFRQKGVLEIEPSLRKTLEREAPEILQFSSKDPIVLLTPSYLRDPETTKQRFIVIDPSIFPRGRNVVNVKNLPLKPNIHDAFVKRKVYVMDPKTMYDIREKLPQLWLANYGVINRRVYRTLSNHEKLLFCYLQYKQFFEYYTLFREPSNTNTNAQRQGKQLNAVQRAKKLVFEIDYERGENPFDLLESADPAEFIKLQEDVLGTVQFRTENDLRPLLSKFTQRSNRMTETVVSNYFGPTTANLNVQLPTRKKRVRQMLTAPEIQKQRAELMTKYKTALQAPSTRSVLPSFLRTRKARNQNQKQWRNTVETARKALLAFNEEHGL